MNSNAYGNTECAFDARSVKDGGRWSVLRECKIGRKCTSIYSREV